MFTRPVLSDFAAVVREAARSALPPITPVARGEGLVLSFAQQRLWFLAQMEGVSQAYHMPMGLRLDGVLNHQALRYALDRIVARHESLRTRFVMRDGVPLQHIADAHSGFALQEYDLRGHETAEAELERLTGEEAGAPFDLEQGPLIRGRLLRLAEQEHVLLVTTHHIVSDGWSQGILVNEFSALYNACRAGEEDPLPPLAIQYADYAAWQRRWVSGEVLQAQSAYWQQTLTTLFMTLLAGWAALLSRLSGQHDLVIGTPMANRTRAEVEPLIGLFLNTLALRIDLSGSPSTADLLQRVKAQALEAQQHQDLPFEQVVEIVNPPRSLAHSPLFQVTFTWNNNEAGELKMPGLVLEPIGSPQVTAQFTMSLLLGEQDAVIGGGLAYATTLFERDTVERMLDYLRRILDAMVKQEYTPIEHLVLLGNAERERLLVEWNATQAEYPDRSCIHELIEARAAASPDTVALEHGGTEVSYAELNARANRLARHLRKQGVSPDTRVAICMTRGIDMVVGLLAVWKAGGAYVPLDPAYPPERLSFMLKDSAPVAVLMHAWIGEQTQYTLLAAAGFAPILDIEADAMRWNEEMQDNLPRSETGAGPEHLAYVIYTSGSTGQPKGVMVAHRGVGNLAQAQIEGFGIDADSRVLQFASFSFDACVSEIVTTLVRGATLVLPASETVLAGEVLAEVLEREGITHVTLPPVVLAGLPEEAQLETVRTLVMAGEASNAALVRRFGHNRRLLNAYGPTGIECGAGAAFRPQPAFAQCLWPDRNHGVRDDAGVRPAKRAGAGDWASDCQHPDLSARRAWSAGAAGGRRRDPYRRRAGGTRLSEPRCIDGRALCCRPVQQ
ncbi:hypothetical protein ASE07_27810 [Noviherbaspirillum sp. Root189]|nr:hypothetical protein ASE07_27810 [Noviherbaspirillum sp. Root189]